MKTKYQIVPLSAKTGKPLKRPIEGKTYKLAVMGPRGGINPLKNDPQVYYKKEIEKINSYIGAAEKPVFELYEQRLRTIKKDPKTGKKLYKIDKLGNFALDKRGKKIPIYDTKIAPPDARRRQKPLLFKKNKFIRPLDLGYNTGNKYQKTKEMQQLKLLVPNKNIVEQKISGDTIKEAISNIRPDVDMKHVKEFGLYVYYNVFAVIESPNGEKTKIPVSGAFSQKGYEEKDPTGFQETFPLIVNGEPEIFGRSKIHTISNLQSKISHSLRIAMKNAGYHFTSLVMLERFEKRMEKEAAKKRDPDEQAKILNSIKGLYFGNKKRNFLNDETKLKKIDKKHSVTLYVKLEMYNY